MKNLSNILILCATIGFGATITSCGSNEKSHEKIEIIDKSGPEYTSTYVCPMHCDGSGSNTSGKCPVCTMAYVENKDRGHEGHNHDGHDHGNHDGHDHSNHDGHNH